MHTNQYSVFGSYHDMLYNKCCDMSSNNRLHMLVYNFLYSH